MCTTWPPRNFVLLINSNPMKAIHIKINLVKGAILILMFIVLELQSIFG